MGAYDCFNTEEIERGWQLLNKGREEEARQLAREIEKKEPLTPEENLRCQILKGYKIISELAQFLLISLCLTAQ